MATPSPAAPPAAAAAPPAAKPAVPAAAPVPAPAPPAPAKAPTPTAPPPASPATPVSAPTGGLKAFPKPAPAPAGPQTPREKYSILFQNYASWFFIGTGTVAAVMGFCFAYFALTLTQYATFLGRPLLWSKPWKMLTTGEEYEKLRGSYAEPGSLEWEKQREAARKVQELDDWLKSQRGSSMSRKNTL